MAAPNLTCVAVKADGNVCGTRVLPQFAAKTDGKLCGNHQHLWDAILQQVNQQLKKESPQKLAKPKLIIAPEQQRAYEDENAMQTSPLTWEQWFATRISSPDATPLSDFFANDSDKLSFSVKSTDDVLTITIKPVSGGTAAQQEQIQQLQQTNAQQQQTNAQQQQQIDDLKKMVEALQLQNADASSPSTPVVS